MTQIYSAASIYGIIDRMDAGEIQRWLDWHKRLHYPPRFINMFTAAKFNEAPNLLRQVRDSLPLTTPIWRGYDGKDAWGNTPNTDWDDSNFYVNLWNHSAMSPAMAAGMWFARRVKPFVDVIRETGAIIHLLNEAQPMFNAPYETEQIRLLGEEGIRAGAFAYAPGTPDWPDYQQQAIEDEIKMAAKYKALVMTHEYAGIKPEEQNSLINRNQNMVTKYDQLKLDKPDVFIGEFGLAKAAINPHTGKIDLDANVGWREMGVSEVQYMDFIKATAKVWYLPNKVSFSVFDWIGWGNNGSFGVSKSRGLLDSLITASEWMSFSVEDKAMPLPATPAPVEIMPRPPEAQRGFRVRVRAIPAPFRNLRESWDFDSADKGDLTPGDVVRRFDIPIHMGRVSAISTGKWIYVEKLDSDLPTANVIAAGYVWGERITWENLTTSTGEVPVVVQEPPPQPSPASDGGSNTPVVPVTIAKRYSFEIKTTDERHNLIEQSLMALIASMVLFGQAMGGVELTLKTDPISN